MGVTGQPTQMDLSAIPSKNTKDLRPSSFCLGEIKEIRHISGEINAFLSLYLIIHATHNNI
jgi:hypothetical protein